MCYKRFFIIILVFPGNCQHGVPETVSTFELAWFGLLPSRDGDQRAIRLSLAQVVVDDELNSNDGDDVNDDVDGDYLHSDSILASLRGPGETGYKIPRGGLFCLLSAPNYFGETLEWCGFAAFAQVAFHLLGCLLAPCTVWESTIYGISLRSKQFRTQITIKESWECFLACIISIFLRPQLLSGLLLGIFSSLGTELSRPTLGISTSLEENILLAEKLSFRTYCDPRIETQC